MLLKQSTLAALTDGTVNTVFRRWQHPRVQPGSKFRTSVGVISVTGIEQTSLKAITERAARRSGYPSRSALLKELARHPGGRLYRITLTPGRTGPAHRASPANQAQCKRARATEEHARTPRRTDRRWSLGPAGPGPAPGSSVRPGGRAGRRDRHGNPTIQGAGAPTQGSRPHREPGGRLQAIAARPGSPASASELNLEEGDDGHQDNELIAIGAAVGANCVT